ncbi:MAG: hypothetical protein Q4B05_04130 [Candidatus Saccharibacteria bacterium]|nr:hypothetical protein [Candidatus Saccharibacteria bacterium]
MEKMGYDHLVSPLTMRALSCAARELEVEANSLEAHPVRGGFSRNRRAVVSAGKRSLFVKEVDTELLPDEGLTELGWLRKDAAIVQALQATHPDIVADWIRLSDDGHVLMMSNYAPEDGWLWQPPTDEALARRYTEAVMQTTRRLETVQLDKQAAHGLDLSPFLQHELVRDDRIDILVDDEAVRRQLKEKYRELTAVGPDWRRVRCERMVALLDDVAQLHELRGWLKSVALQPDDCFNHCDVRSDNLAFNVHTGEVKLVDWNWASYAPRGYGATEFLLDMARHGHDISPWYGEINQPMIAASIGFFAVRSLKPPLTPGGTLREMQALAAAVAHEIWQEVKA